MKKVINQGQFKTMSSEAVTARWGKGLLRCYLAFLGFGLMKDKKESAELIDSKSLFVLIILKSIYKISVPIQRWVGR